MLKYLLQNHLHKHHGIKESGFLHRDLEYDALVKEHPEFSVKVQQLFEKLRHDLQKLVDEFREEN